MDYSDERGLNIVPQIPDMTDPDSIMRQLSKHFHCVIRLKNTVFSVGVGGQHSGLDRISGYLFIVYFFPCGANGLHLDLPRNYHDAILVSHDQVTGPKRDSVNFDWPTDGNDSLSIQDVIDRPSSRVNSKSHRFHFRDIAYGTIDDSPDTATVACRCGKQFTPNARYLGTPGSTDQHVILLAGVDSL